MPEDTLFDLHPQEVVETDVAVIGGGIMGLATAYYLAKRGTQVAVLERRTFGCEASGRTAAGVRQQGRDPREIPLAKASVALWGSLAEELGAETHYRRSGNIYVALMEEELIGLRAAAEVEQSFGLRTEILGAQQLRKMVPVLSAQCVGGKYCPTDGMAEPAAVIPAFVNAAQRAGARLYPYTEAADFVVEDGRVGSILTEKIEFRPRVTVNAAGPWAPLLAMRAGIVLPIRPVRAQIVETETVGPLFKEFLIFEGADVYCRPTLGGTTYIGPLSGIAATDLAKPALPLATVPQVRKMIASLIPALEGVPIRRTWLGLLDVTPDVVPIIGPVPGLRDYIVAAGFSGHGFCLGPGVGQVLSELIVDGRPSVSLEAFSLTRFLTE
jgi:sarcosine oxidase subunit beta